MRLVRLDLERYGPFTGASLSFRPDARLHVVLGENEAGKSCALAALTDLFFGIERQTRYDFLHEGKELRVGAEIRSRSGGRLTFRRRKGTKNTLLATDDAPLAEEGLAPFLGGLTREVFCRAFGLNAATLRDGAEEMLQSEGEVGATLFAAASGLRGMTELRRDLESDADAIFTDRRAQHRRFYQALDRFEAARRAMRDRELKAADWKALNTKIDALSARLESIDVRLHASAAEHARISRLKRLAPQVALIDADLRALDGLGALPPVPAGFAARLRVSLDAMQSHQDALKRARSEEELAGREHGSIAVDDALLAISAEVQQLLAQTGAYAAERRDLPRIQAEADAFHASLAELAVRLGLSGPEGIEARHPTDQAKALVRRLLADGRTIRSERGAKEEQLGAERLALLGLERERAERGTLADPKPLRDRLAAIAPVLKQIDRCAELGIAVRAEEERLTEAAARLRPSANAVEAIARAALPSAEAIARCGGDLDAIAEDIRRAEDRLARAEEDARAAEIRLHPLTLAGPVPSPAAIAAIRGERDAQWSALRAALSGAPDALTGTELAGAVAAFERLKSDADRLADQAVGDAKRVADYGNESRILAEARVDADRSRDRLAALHALSAEMQRSWAGLWTDAGILPLSPAEMLLWLNGVAALLDRRDRLVTNRGELAALQDRIRSVEPALLALARDLGLARLEGLHPGLVSAQVEARFAELAAAWDEARDLDTRRRETEARAERLRGEADEIAGRETAWRAAWEPALGAAEFPSGLTLEQAEAVLAVWDEVPTVLRERANRRARVSGMLRNAAAFEGAAAKWVAAAAGDLSGLPADVAVKSLSERVSAASQAKARRAEAAKRLAAARRETAVAEGALAQAEAAVARLSADLPEESDLQRICAGLAERDELWEALAAKRTQFTTHSDGLPEDTVRAELATFDRDQAEAALGRLGDEQQALSKEANEVFADHRDAEKQRAALQEGIGAELAAQQRRGAEAELASAARDWAVLKLASLLLGEAMERHRAGQQDPLMRRAGDLFASLTGGSFAELVQDYDEADAPRLAGRRPGGALVHISGMSEGTRDQLYLALRLAYLEDYALRAEPAPFIGDDLFATFDDRRTVNGLKAMASIGDHVQPILFTHHQHVAEAARAALGSQSDILELC